MSEKPEKPDPEWQLEVIGRPDLTTLKQKMLKIDGKRFQRNSFLDHEISPGLCLRLNTQGVFCKSPPVLTPMGAGNCHENSVKLSRKLKCELWTGFCIDDDDIWRIHSWAVNDGKIIETTSIRLGYFGVKTTPGGLR